MPDSSESGTRRVVPPGPSADHQPSFPQSVIHRFDARYGDIYGIRGVDITATLVRDRRALAGVEDRRLIRVLTEGHLQLGIRSNLTGHWQAYFPDLHSYADLPWGDKAYFDLGRATCNATWWFFPDVPDSFILWLFVYGDGRLLPFDPAEAFPHRVDSNGALRSFVPN